MKDGLSQTTIYYKCAPARAAAMSKRGNKLPVQIEAKKKQPRSTQTSIDEKALYEDMQPFATSGSIASPGTAAITTKAADPLVQIGQHSRKDRRCLMC